jgi:hypothetical protein
MAGGGADLLERNAPSEITLGRSNHKNKRTYEMGFG